MAQPATDSRPTKASGRAAAQARPGRPADPPEEAAEAVMGLDLVLVDAARGPLRRLGPPAGPALGRASSRVRQRGTAARRSGELVRELGRIGTGRSELTPGRKDKR